MPPKRSIHTCPNTVLRHLAIGMTSRINTISDTLDLAGWSGAGRDRAGNEGNKAFYWTALEDLRAGWFRFDIVVLSGKDSLSESERVRWRQQCRELERDGFCEISGQGRSNFISFTEAGLKRLQDLPNGPELIDKLNEALARSNANQP